jgi:hypothetical protein
MIELIHASRNFKAVCKKEVPAMRMEALFQVVREWQPHLIAKQGRKLLEGLPGAEILMECPDNKGRSFLIADKPENLHTFAESCGLRLNFLREISGCPCYELMNTVTLKAAIMGARIVTRTEWINFAKTHYPK